MNAIAPVRSGRTRSSWFIDQLTDEATLREAWFRVQRGGKTPGVDGVTIDSFRRGADHRLTQLGDAVRNGVYRAAPVKRLQIPKPLGGWRTLGVPTIADRLLQTAAALVLHERIAMLFSDRSFAYRPFLGPRRAALFLRSRIASAEYVVTADIEKFFDNVEHRVLTDQLRTVGVDDRGVQLMLSWLLAPAKDGQRTYQPVKGLPQGASIAPILANLYLTGFDTALEAEGYVHVRYADDFVVLSPSEADARSALRYLTTYLTSRLHLNVKPAKTQMTRADGGFGFVGFRFSRATWTIPEESIARFKDSIDALLAGDDRRQLLAAAKQHNDQVRGWRHYYQGNSSEMNAQLATLDSWRVERCVQYLARCGQDPDGAVVWFEGLIDEADPSLPPGVYGHREESGAKREGVIDEWHQPLPSSIATPERVFSTARQLHEAAIGERQQPELIGRWLRVPTFGAFVSKSRAVLLVRRKKQTIFECALDEVSCLTTEADGVAISTTLIDECARRGIAIAICRISGKPIARVIPARSPLTAPLVRKQFAARSGRTGTRLSTAILHAKLSNQRALLLYHAKYRKRAEPVRNTMAAAAARIEQCRSMLDQTADWPLRTARQRLFLTEGKAAAHYWHGFAALLPEELGFTRRAHRDAVDVVNKALNYGYALLLNRVWVAVHRAGLEPTLGLLHTGRRRSAGLVFDLMEPFRQPLVDRAVLALVGRGARLSLNAKGELTLRTRSLLQRAITGRLTRKRQGNGTTMAIDIHHHVLNFRRALVDGSAYQPYRMTW